MRATEAVDEARRVIEICNACRYCEGYCAVFPAMELKRAFADEDMAYLANLCHNCKGCYHACQFSPPHEFNINLPKTFAELRSETYEEYAWPRPLGRLFARNGVVVSLVTALAIAFVLAMTMDLQSPAALHRANAAPGAFYAVIPWGIMVSVAGATFVYALLALAMSGRNFWRDIQTVPRRPVTARAVLTMVSDVATLRYLGNDGDGCNDEDDGFSQSRQRFHHALFYGFLLCFASTCVATIYDHFLRLEAPYPVLSLPVLLGLVGGVGLLVGTLGLGWIKLTTDKAPVARSVLGGDYAFLLLLALAAATGLLLLVLRQTSAMGILLAVHLGIILALFLALPYSKFVHAVHRSLALLKAAVDRQAS